MIIKGIKSNSSLPSNKKKFEGYCVSFSSSSEPVYKVLEKSFVKKSLPILAFAASLISATGYFLGGCGLLYDIYNDKKNNIKEKEEAGVKTIIANTNIAKAGMICTKVGITAASVANIACGLGEGVPLMALGEASNLGAAPIIETPIGTGLFGIGIASIFAGLALDNTPELKLNEFDLMAQDGFKNKLKLVAKNTAVTAKEISVSMLQIAKNIFNPKFLKENFLQITPKTVVFSEAINKDGKVILSKMLRHKKNYLMHAASFTLAIGGGGIILASLLNRKKEQKAALKVEEGGFLFDNLGITKYGIDRITTGNKASGTSFAIGGVVNAISQFVGLDNKDGRALQWLGISGVFLGYTIDRGKFLQKSLKNAVQRTELTKIVREWKLNLTELVTDKVELKKLMQEIKTGKPVTNSKFIDLENNFKDAIGTNNFRATKDVESVLERKIGLHLYSKVERQEVAEVFKTQDTLKICTEKVFGKNPIVINEKSA